MGACGLLTLACTVLAAGEHQTLTRVRDEAGQERTIQSVADWELRRAQIRKGLEAVMGPFPDVSKLPALDVQILEETTVGQLRRQKLSYRSDAEDRVTAILFLPIPQQPASKPERRPAILCLHQTTGIGKEEPAGMGGNPHLHYALELAKRGYVTLAPDYPSFGEHPYDFAASHRYVSGTMKAIVDNVRAVDLLQTLPEVDPARIGCVGHSLGGHNTLFTSFFEPRIKVLASSCGYTRFHRYYEGKLAGWTSPRYMPRIAEVYGNHADRVPFDFPEIIAGVAPRPFFSNSPLHDSNFDVQGVKETEEAVRPIYALYGERENLIVEYPDAQHDFPDEVRERCYEFFDRHLNWKPVR